MRKRHFGYITILSTALCLVFTACNQSLTAGKGTGEVRVVIGGGNARSVNAEGLPIFDEHNTRITVTDENGTQLAQGTTSVTLRVGVNKKITVEATITTAAGIWRGSKEHTVTAGTNTVAIKLSKAPKSVGNILIDVDSIGRACTLKTASGKQLLSGIPIDTHDGVYPVIARDRIGRVYVLYKKTFSIRHLKRFDVEGEEDTRFEGRISETLAHSGTGATIDNIDNIAIDTKNNTIFLFYDDSGTSSPNVLCINETTPNTFTCSASVDMHDLAPSINGTSARKFSAAAYNGMLFFAVYHPDVPPTMYNLFACKAELSGTTLTLRKVGEPQSITQLRTDPSFGNHNTECTGLFADESGVYCLLARKDDANHHAVGKLIRYVYSDSGLTQKAEKGLNPETPNSHGILTVNAQYFSNPIGFIGSDEENIYIADDGVNFEYTHENVHSTGNKNRIAAVNRKTDRLTFSNTDATWYAEFPEYKEPNTKVLLWENDHSTPAYTGVRYWVSNNGTEAISATNKVWEEEASSAKELTDIFCYDQDGNLYILWKHGLDYKVRRFELKKEDGSYKPGMDSGTIDSAGRKLKYIAVDISDGQNCLYYGSEDGNWRVSKVKWYSDFTSLTASETIKDLDTDEKMTALAANKDGVFVALEKEDTVSGSPKYWLKVKKYKKDKSDDGEITLVDGGIRYKNASNTPLGGVPSSYDYKEITETIDDLQVVESVLYAITSRRTKTMKDISDTGTGTAHGNYKYDAVRNDGFLYKVGNTKDSFSGNVDSLAKKDAVDTDGEEAGYGFYRFIAVKPKKLVIASDSAYGTNGAQDPKRKDTDTALEYDLDGHLQNGENGKKAGGSFSKQLGWDAGCGFAW